MPLKSIIDYYEKVPIPMRKFFLLLKYFLIPSNSVFAKPVHHREFVTRSIFEESKAGLKSEFSS